MAEKLTPAGLVVGLILNEEPVQEENPVQAAPSEEQPKQPKRKPAKKA